MRLIRMRGRWRLRCAKDLIQINGLAQPARFKRATRDRQVERR
jgi:hypothetical protein